MKKESRLEIKFKFNSSQMKEFISKYELSNYLHPARNIESIYFDTVNFKLFENSLFSDSQNFKVRYRYYDKDLSKIYKEIKISNPLGKSKTSEIQSNLNQIPNQIYFKGLNLIPVSKVSYDRKYFKFNNSRVTIDSKIQFSTVGNRSLNTRVINKNFFIVEFKILNKENFNVYNDLPAYPVSYSKFKSSVKELYNHNINF